MHQPADVGRELLRLGAGENHAVIERVQEASLGDPALLLDELAMHDRDLPGRTAEADPAEFPPVAQRLGACRRSRFSAVRIHPIQRDRGADFRRAEFIRPLRQMSPSSNCTSTSSPAAMLPVSLASTMKQFACDIDDKMPE